MARLLSVALAFSFISTGLAGPACATKYYKAKDCMTRCNLKWGFPGLMMATDPWGSVMHRVDDSEKTWNKYLANACGQDLNDSLSSAESSSSSDSETSSTAAERTPGLVKGSTKPATTSTTSRFSSVIRSTTTSTTSTRTTTSTTSTKAQEPTLDKAEQPQQTQKAADNNDDDDDDNNSKSNSNSNSNSLSDDKDSGNSNSGSSNSGGGNGSKASDADREAYLKGHNTIRAQHGAKPLVWDNGAAAKAQEWANKCTNEHSGGTLGPLGENLAAGTGSFSIAEAVKAWTDESSEYNPRNPQFSHFTQVVWKATTKVGCAVATCNGIFEGFGAAQYYVCEYSEQGNVQGEFDQNVQA
ncbi:CAP domain-containing protein [Mycena rebaudengoi]|nr:CAP domain-containing protein [Mycena rebaudengoi]